MTEGVEVARGGEHERSRELVVVGHGMVSHRFCEAIVKRELHRHYHVTVIGSEPEAAYDRVHLGEVLEGRADRVALADPCWYERHGIRLELGRPVARIDRDRREVISECGEAYAYDALVLATGARPRLPELPAVDRVVHVYRTFADVQRLRAVATPGRTIAILGGGLLGLECADALRKLGCRVRVLVASASLLSRQLDATSARTLQRMIEALGIAVQTGYRLRSVERMANGSLALCDDRGEQVCCDVVVAAIGIVPVDDLARQHGIDCSEHGGVSVSNTLATSDPFIHAIGDCAAYGGSAPGLVAPGYEMADVLAARLAGDRTRTFVQSGRVCQLKLAGIDVMACGRYDLELGERYGHQAETTARVLTVHEGKLVGATAVGPWDERFAVQQAVEAQRAVSAKQLRNFERTGRLALDRRELPVAAWPRESIVCHCANVTRGTLSDLARAEGASLQTVQAACAAGTICGSCLPLVCELVGVKGERPEPHHVRWVAVAAALVLFALIAAALGSPLAEARSFRAPNFELATLLRTSMVRQLTGYVATALFVGGLLLSLRKRSRALRWGSFATYRALHTCLGLASLLALCLHTGLSLGSNLNLALSSVFAVGAFAGALAGLAVAIESRLGSARARTVRAALSRAHVYVLWPLPALLVFHIVAAYYF
jgi:nitrite reductase (NADH) large subunit